MAILSHLNWVDYFIVAIFFISTLAGISRGLVKEILSLITLVAAFVVAMLFSNQLATSFANSAAVQSAVNQASTSMGASAASQSVSYAAIGVSFAVLFAGTILLGAIITFFINLAFKTGVIGVGNRLFGGLFGFVRGFIFNLVIIFLVQLTSFSSETWWQQSYFVGEFQPAIIWVATNVSPNLSDLKNKFGTTMTNVESKVQSPSQPTQ